MLNVAQFASREFSFFAEYLSVCLWLSMVQRCLASQWCREELMLHYIDMDCGYITLANATENQNEILRGKLSKFFNFLKKGNSYR